MNRWFGDSFFFVALLSSADQAHERAVELLHEFDELVTTAWVLTEVADGFAETASGRAAFARLLSLLRPNARVVIAPASQALFDRGVELYHERPDKAWSQTDSISFVVMGEQGLNKALTADHHFEQAGFVALMKQA